MSDGDGRVSWEILAQKFLVAGFLKAQLSTDVLKKFEDEVARGREYANSYVVHIDHTVRPSQFDCTSRGLLANDWSFIQRQPRKIFMPYA